MNMCHTRPQQPQYLAASSVLARYLTQTSLSAGVNTCNILETLFRRRLQRTPFLPYTEPRKPVLFVPKPDGSTSMCMDYRALNKATTSNTHPLPTPK
jgi:hypothetical protein